jgi:hypothetical protein
MNGILQNPQDGLRGRLGVGDSLAGGFDCGGLPQLEVLSGAAWPARPGPDDLRDERVHAKGHHRVLEVRLMEDPLVASFPSP